MVLGRQLNRIAVFADGKSILLHRGHSNLKAVGCFGRAHGCHCCLGVSVELIAFAFQLIYLSLHRLSIRCFSWRIMFVMTPPRPSARLWLSHFPIRRRWRLWRRRRWGRRLLSMPDDIIGLPKRWKAQGLPGLVQRLSDLLPVIPSAPGPFIWVKLS